MSNESAENAMVYLQSTGSDYRGRNDITKVTLDSRVTKIPDLAFEGCVSLETLELNEGLEEIGEYAVREIERT